MLKWLRPRGRTIRADSLTPELWRSNEHLSLFVLIAYWLSEGQDTEAIFESGRSSLAAAGFADGWASPLTDGPKRFAHIDSHTIDRFVQLQVGGPRRHLTDVTIDETAAYDLSYRSGIEASGTRIAIAFHEDAAAALRDYVHAHEVDGSGHRNGAFAIRMPVDKRFEFPAPRGSETPYASGPSDLLPLRHIAKFTTDWVEVAAIMAHPSQDALKSAPLCDLFSTAEVQRIALV